MTTLAAAFQQLLAILGQLEVRFLIGGSVASGNYGMPRLTNDIDILADFNAAGVSRFCALL
ncbi:MAG: hypothetical protein JJE04_24285 [Acidobacteriia bacterium]|nr:hypothetical protein [Terriglobia bacterium]